MAKVTNGVKTFPKISIAWVGRTNVTDRQTTDRQTTDGRTTTYSEPELEFTFAKNWRPFLFITVCQFYGVTPFSWKNWRPFLLITVTFSDFARVSPPSVTLTPHIFYLSDLVCPLLFCKFAHNFFRSGVTPWSGGCSPPPLSDATAGDRDFKSETSYLLKSELTVTASPLHFYSPGGEMFA